MSQSYIGIENEDGSVEFVYCRDTDSDILFERYTTIEDIEELVSYGDMSKLGSFIHPSEVGKNTHSFTTPEPDVCIFYHRDGGDELEITKLNSLDEVKTFGNFDGFLYIYSMRESKWLSYPKVKQEQWVTLGIG